MVGDLRWIRPDDVKTRDTKLEILVWWDYKGILHFEVLLKNQTINWNMYVQLLAKLRDAI